jgi:hypothetical protein
MSAWRTVLSRGGATIGAAALIIGLGSAGASAAPETPINYPAGASATTYSGLGFDTCTAPSLAAMRAWTSTAPYDTVNIYFGGNNRGCAQPNLTTDWIRTVNLLGWKILPTYMGHQPFCMNGNKPNRFTEATATTLGTSDANDAITKARALGLLPGSALYADVEHYDRTNASCRTAVLKYASAWTTTLHNAGYLAGIYVHQDSGLRDLADHYTSTTYARPDAVWMARWDGNDALTGWPTATNAQWGFWQRIKQYRGDHNETWGGVTLNIDSDSLRAPVATVARAYTTTGAVNARRGPSASAEVVRTYQSGASVRVMCQTTGGAVGGSTVWDQLSDGTWVPDSYVSTPTDDFNPGLPLCTYPGQVSAGNGATARTGPGTSFPAGGAVLPRGALAYVQCQIAGETVGTTSVWNKLADGRWVSDLDVSNASDTTWTPNIPRCH